MISIIISSNINNINSKDNHLTKSNFKITVVVTNFRKMFSNRIHINNNNTKISNLIKGLIINSNKNFNNKIGNNSHYNKNKIINILKCSNLSINLCSQ